MSYSSKRQMVVERHNEAVGIKKCKAPVGVEGGACLDAGAHALNPQVHPDPALVTKTSFDFVKNIGLVLTLVW